MATPDRIEALQQTDNLVGIDFVYVSTDQVTLSVFFYPSHTKTPDQILGAILPSQIIISSPSGGESVPVVPVTAVAWAALEGRTVLQITTSEPGDFSLYTLQINAANGLIDPFFNNVTFSFKVNCPSELDCAPPVHECPPDTPVDFPVNYLARDFFSFQQALIDFASVRYPDWQDRTAADQGMMLLEIMSALGDEFSYFQDRIAREPYLETATQRRSVRRLARLVDYPMHDGLGATTWLDFTVTADGSVPAGTPVWETLLRQTQPNVAARKAASRSIFEAGNGLADGHVTFIPPAKGFNVRLAANQLLPYSWDAGQTCLPVGATSFHIGGHHAADLPLEDLPVNQNPGKWVLLRTSPADASITARTWLVRLIQVTDTIDPLYDTPITFLEWETAQATPFEMQYESLVVRGNLVPATSGETRQGTFQIDPQTPPATPAANTAIERQGPLLNNPPPTSAEETAPPFELSPAFLYTLPGSDQRNIIWLGPAPTQASPEVRLFQIKQANPPVLSEWQWKVTFLGVNSSLPTDTDFMLDDGSWWPVVHYRRVDEIGTTREYTHNDYATGDGTTIRFGDGDFGQPPARGTSFNVVYRLGNGHSDNVAAGSLIDFDPAALPFVSAVTNCFDATNAVAPETLDEVRLLAPQAFQATTYRAVRLPDYVDAVERLPWVDSAGARARWTGSWSTIFATPAPEGTFQITVDERTDLQAQLDRFRLAGREAFGLDPIFVAIDLIITICVAPTSYPGDVEAAVLKTLFGKTGLLPEPGFFSPDNFSFGSPLDRTLLEAAIQAAPGVRAVEGIQIRRRGWFDWRGFTEPSYAVAADEIIRIENNPLLPERGVVQIKMDGGA